MATIVGQITDKIEPGEKTPFSSYFGYSLFIMRAQYKSSDHLSVCCPVTLDTWRGCVTWLGISTALPNQVIDFFLWYSGLLHPKRGIKFAICIWECVVWILWKTINKVIFEGGEINVHRILEEAKGRVWSWCIVKNLISSNASMISG